MKFAVRSIAVAALAMSALGAFAQKAKQSRLHGLTPCLV